MKSWFLTTLLTRNSHLLVSVIECIALVNSKYLLEVTYAFPVPAAAVVCGYVSTTLIYCSSFLLQICCCERRKEVCR